MKGADKRQKLPLEVVYEKSWCWKCCNIQRNTLREHLLLIKWRGKIPMRHLSDGSEMSMSVSFETYLRRHWYAPKDVSLRRCYDILLSVGTVFKTWLISKIWIYLWNIPIKTIRNEKRQCNNARHFNWDLPWSFESCWASKKDCNIPPESVGEQVMVKFSETTFRYKSFQ